MQKRFTTIAATTILILAVFNANAALALTGTKYTLNNIWQSFYCTALSFCEGQILASDSKPVSEATINIQTHGYTPANITVAAGSPVTLKLVNQDGAGCAQAFTIPKLGIQKVVAMKSSETVTFTAPNEPQELAFMCSMGMYRGIIHVI